MYTVCYYYVYATCVWRDVEAADTTVFRIFVGCVFTRAIVCFSPPTSIPRLVDPHDHHFIGNDVAFVVFVCIFYCSLE